MSIKININGIITDATRVEVISADERWNEYQLADGTVIRVKLVLTQVVRAEGIKARDGIPIYQIQASNVMDVRMPDKSL